MPTPREVTRYEIEYIKLFEHAARKRMVLECKDADEAARLRHYLYGVRRALLLDPAPYPLSALLAPLVAFQIEGSNLIAEPRNQLHSIVAEALDNDSHDAPTGSSEHTNA